MIAAAKYKISYIIGFKAPCIYRVGMHSSTSKFSTIDNCYDSIITLCFLDSLNNFFRQDFFGIHQTARGPNYLVAGNCDRCFKMTKVVVKFLDPIVWEGVPSVYIVVHGYTREKISDKIGAWINFTGPDIRTFIKYI